MTKSITTRPVLVTRTQYDTGVLPHIRDWFESENRLAQATPLAWSNE